MKNFKKFLCVSMVLVMLLGSAVGCGSSQKIKSTKEESKVVGTCAGYKVRYEELAHLVYVHKEEMKAEYGEDIFADDTYEDELFARVEASLCEHYAILDICERAGVKRSNKQTKNEVQEEVDAVIQEMGIDGYKEYLKATHLTDTVYRLYTAIVSCQYRYYEEVAFEELEKEAYDAVLAGEGFVHTLQILVCNDEGEDPEDNRKQAEFVRDAVWGGERLEDFIGTKYNQDMSNCEYYFPEGYKEAAYERVAFSLEIGEVSDVVETSEGFCVIQRLALDPAYMELNLEDLMTAYVVGKMNLTFEEHAATLSFEMNDYGKSLSLFSME